MRAQIGDDIVALVFLLQPREGHLVPFVERLGIGEEFLQMGIGPDISGDARSLLHNEAMKQAYLGEV